MLRLPATGNRSIEHPLDFQHTSQIEMGLGKVRVYSECFPVLLRRLTEPPLCLKCKGQMETHVQRIWMTRRRLQYLPIDRFCVRQAPGLVMIDRRLHRGFNGHLRMGQICGLKAVGLLATLLIFLAAAARARVVAPDSSSRHVELDLLAR